MTYNIFFVTGVVFDRVPTGQGSWKKVREFEWSGKGQGKYFLEKSGRMKNWCHELSDFQARMHQIQFSDPAEGAYSTPPDSLAAFITDMFHSYYKP